MLLETKVITINVAIITRPLPKSGCSIIRAKKAPPTIKIIRVVFKKDRRLEAIEYSKKLMKKGYKVALNPMNTIGYSTEELFELLKLVNDFEIKVYILLHIF